jgi:hypothetical protein
MNSSKALRFVLSGLLLIGVAACDGDETTDLSTTSSLIASPTTGGDDVATTTTLVAGGESTTTSLVGETVSDYDVVARVSEDAGETLFIVIPPGAYTDVDIENFLIGLVDDEEVTYGAEVFDDTGAVDAFRKPEAERTEGETQLVAQHHFASIQNGTSVVFRGPFASSPGFVIGS